MPPRRCCCGDCLLAEDDFNRPDSEDPGPLWFGDAEISNNELLVHDLTSLTVCSPYPDGSFWAYVELIDPENHSPYRMRFGDPAGSIEAKIEFTGTVGSGTFKISLTGVPEAQEHTYDWENEVESILICYAPKFMISVGPGIGRESSSAFAPPWVSSCIDIEGEPCFTIGSQQVGNFHFLEGRFDNFEIQNHAIEREECPECDCHCREEDELGNIIRTCLPAELTLVVDGGCLDGEYTLFQEFPTEVSNSGIVTSPNTSKTWWVSEEVECPAVGTDTKLRFVLQCNQTGFNLLVTRYGELGINCSAIGFDPDDPDTLTQASQIGQQSDARNKPYTCDPLVIPFPDLCEYEYGCNIEAGSCCGGGIESEFADESDPVCMGVTVTL